VREGYRMVAAADSARVRRIDASQPAAAVLDAAWALVADVTGCKSS
jgi:thymidylate kinase